MFTLNIDSVDLETILKEADEDDDEDEDDDIDLEERQVEDQGNKTNLRINYQLYDSRFKNQSGTY